MTKKFNQIFALCLALTLVLSGCGVQNNEGIEDTIPDDTKVFAPEDTQDTTGSTEDITEPTEDSTEPVEVPEDTTEPVEYTTQPIEYTGDITEPAVAPEDNESVIEPLETGEPISIGEALLSGETVRGKLISKESEKMRLVLNYICQMNEYGSVYTDFEVGLECYDINCGPRENGGKITVNGETYTFSTDRIVHEERTMVYIPFDSYSCEISAGETACNIEASWFFNGVYAGVELDTLTVLATLEWAKTE